MNFSDIPILSIGNTIQLVGTVYAGEGKHYVLLLPNEGESIDLESLSWWPIEMSPEDWKACLTQSDLCQTEVSNGTSKAILRKCERIVDAELAWRVYRKAGYICEYCGQHRPLTVDHLIPWEECGPTIEANLLAVCKRCNRKRGNMPYTEWIKSEYYLKSVQNVPQVQRMTNEAKALTLDKIPRVNYIRSR